MGIFQRIGCANACLDFRLICALGCLIQAISVLCYAKRLQDTLKEYHSVEYFLEVDHDSSAAGACIS